MGLGVGGLLSHNITEFDLVCLSMLQFSYKIMNHYQSCSLTILGFCPVDFFNFVDVWC